MAGRDDEFYKYIKERMVNCVRAFLSHPGIDVSIKNNEGLTVRQVHTVCLYCMLLYEYTYMYKNGPRPLSMCVFHHHRFLKGNYERQQEVAAQRR